MDWTYFDTIIKKDVVVAGIDEAGRGPLFGPVVAAAVILPYGLEIEGLNDSKKISEKKREKLFDIIKEKAIDYSIAQCSPREIDELNILGATMLAMKKAYKGLKVKPEMLLIDGNRATGFDLPVKTVIKGDALVPSISAASILAKVTRDRYCIEMDKVYPEYQIAVHKGYPTKLHREKVISLGPTPEHRLSFLKNLDKWKSEKDV
ncbi:MAG: ribonuclease HII [Ruminococcaceae bacterium]|nr:ribonuclease HII [Oscillospiraceae bacterium]